MDDPEHSRREFWRPDPLPTAAQAQIFAAPSIPDHQLLRRIGRGSYGEVWLARNIMGVHRAVKIICRSSFKDHRPFERELSGIRMFEPISRSHGAFVDVLHLGMNEERGYFYYVMELGDDQTSGQEIDPEKYAPKTLAKEISTRGRLPFDECLRLGLALSQALSDLHKNGLVHRDVKPSNVIFVNGVAKLADIGLVATSHEALSYVGTEGFIPPEGPGSPQADVFSIGKLLYEASTGRDRFEFPALPTSWDEFPDSERLRELNEIILIACDRDPGKRFASGWELYSNLLILADGGSVRRLRKLERRWSNLKRIVGILALTLAILGLLGIQVYRELKNRMETRHQKLGANIAYGIDAMESGDLLGSLPFFVEALRMDSANPDRVQQHRIRLGSIIAQCPKLVQMWSLQQDVFAVAFSPDGTRVLALEWFGKARVLDANSGRALTPPFAPGFGLRRGGFDPTGNFIVTASEDNTACVWRASDGTKILTLAHPGQVLTATFSHDGQRILTGCMDGIGRVWDAHTGAPMLQLEGHTKGILHATFSPNDELVATCSQDHTARIWDGKNGEPLSPPLQHPKWVQYCAFSPDNGKLVTACDDHKARVWNVSTGASIAPDLNHRDVVTSAEFSPDGGLILTGSCDGTARIWLADDHQPAKPNPILRQGERVNHAVFDPTGHQILTACTDGTVRLWEVGNPLAPLSMPWQFSDDSTRFLVVTNKGFQVRDTASQQPVSPWFSPDSPVGESRLSVDGRFVMTTAATAKHVAVWNAESGTRIASPLPLTNSLRNMVLSRDGQLLVTFAGRIAQTWDTHTGKTLSPGVQHDANVQGAVLNSSGTVVATWSGGVVKVWNARTGNEVFPPLHHDSPEMWVEFDAKGIRLVTYGADSAFTKCYAQVWDTATGRPIGPALKHADGILQATFSADGTRLATASEDFSVIVWDFVSGKALVPLKHEDQVWSTSFSSDGKLVLTAGADKAARIWSADTGDPLGPPLIHPAALNSAKFIADGRTIVTSDRRGGHSFWTLPIEQRSPDDLLTFLRLLCLRPVSPMQSRGFEPSQSLQQLWDTSRLEAPPTNNTTGQHL